MKPHTALLFGLGLGLTAGILGMMSLDRSLDHVEKKSAASVQVKVDNDNGNDRVVYVTAIYDGDTFSFNMPGLPPKLNPLKIRVRGVDTPERGGKAKCDAERNAADRAREFTKKLIHGNGDKVLLKNLDWDKYGGRVDADVYVGDTLLSDRLIAGGYGREYHGEKRDIGWCN
jgi:endonuclease YncB( thermonuclease family)